ncbi:MAG: PLP-dependent transferase [Candidatus Gottesmanbacteria bacterium]|nr:PLP-dependent transferase [Candidatus Gottesmanbacteria bacterium]
MKHNEESSDLASQARTDLREDCAEKYTLFVSLQKSLPRRDPSQKIISSMLTRLSKANRTTNVSTLRKLKRGALMLYRTIIIESAGRIVAPNWQSPSALHSIHDEAGNESGTITMTMNDYKRDYHRDAIPYEQAFRKAYIDGLVTMGVHVYLVSSGMAGLTTILSYLQGEKFMQGTVIVGENTYFQGKGLILAASGPRATLVPETDTTGILLLIKKKKPTAIFLDSLTNSATMEAPDLPTILDYLVKHTRHDMALVIGNTALSIAWQPLRLILGRNRHLRLVVYESLIKFHEFGTDRVTAGVIWAYGPGTEKLFDYRKNCGTNITDFSAHCLPMPNRQLLEIRMNRMHRNAHYLADRLESFISSGHAPAFSGVVYPGLPTHPSYAWTKNYHFHGCLIALRYKNQKATINAARSFIRRAIKDAQRRNVPLVAGTSFGFDTTRLYLTASNTDYGEPFLRIAVGTEDVEQLDSVVALIEDMMEKN